MNKRLLLTVGATSLIISASAAMAAAPGGGGFGQYTANAGVITSNSIVGQTAAAFCSRK
jgi:ABC-type methionine transport system permease subunit